MNNGLILTVLHSIIFILHSSFSSAQLHWQNVDSFYQPLPASVHVYFTNEQMDTGVFRAYYLIADLKDNKLDFTADTTRDRRITPQQFYERDGNPLVVVNCTFFSYETNRSVNVVVKDGNLVAYNNHSIPGKGKDTLTYKHTLASAFGISSKREPNIKWTYTDSLTHSVYATHHHFIIIEDSATSFNLDEAYELVPGPDTLTRGDVIFGIWKEQTVIGGGPVVLQNGEIDITNNQELKFAGKAINDKHPRTAMGYTKDGKLIILMIEGRNKVAHGATLGQEAQIFKDLGCWEALNLDGGGSSCLLINGKETIKPSDAIGERPVPAVFIIKKN